MKGHGQGGFTLVEMLIVMVLLAILTTLSIIGIGAVRGNANAQACRADVDTYQAAVDAYRTVIGPGIPNMSDMVTGGGSVLIKRPSKFSATMSVDGSGSVANSACP